MIRTFTLLARIIILVLLSAKTVALASWEFIDRAARLLEAVSRPFLIAPDDKVTGALRGK